MERSPEHAPGPPQEEQTESLRTRTLVPHVQPVRSLDPAQATAVRVEIVGGPMDGTAHLVESDVIAIGRSSSNQVPLKLDPLVSTRHARITREGGVLWLEDLGSRNGTYLGGQRIEQRTPVGPGSLVYLGGTCLELIPS